MTENDAPRQGSNRLVHERSPYLLQHAHNPVDWYPWGDEAIARARELDRPIFLSVGYSTCHWCHVMERESFEDHRTATLMNERFINIKVDREEHPDVDQIYMSALQAMTGQGGWPMSVFLTPGLEPFMAGTYFPPEARWGRPGFPEILANCADSYAKQKDAMVARAAQITAHLGQSKSQPSDGKGTESRLSIKNAVDRLDQTFDTEWGGFGGAPKFPRSMTLMLLLRAAACEVDESGDANARGRKVEMVERTLEMMWRGGMYDHLGGGFARYSTDDQWLIPHFEKMLYDNALLAISYTEAWQVTKNEDWRRVVTEVLDWVLQEMTHPDGGFFSAQDADSEGVEGEFYAWTPEELIEVLGESDAAFFSIVFGVHEGANFEGRSVLYLPRSLDDCAEKMGIERAELESRLSPLRSRLYAHRDQRVHPGLDDKVLCSWNGLMIAAMARAGAVFEVPRFLEAAERAATFVESKLRDDDGLLRSWRDGEAALAGTIEDYAFLSWGHFELFEATGEPRWLEAAARHTRATVERFRDSESGDFFFAAEGTPHLILRLKEPYDSATPAGGNVAIMNLLRLADLLGETELRDLAEKSLAGQKGIMAQNPLAYPFLLCALDRGLSPPSQIVLAVGENDRGESKRMLKRARDSFLPHATAIIVERRHAEALRGRLPWLKGKEPLEGKTTAYVCRDFGCRQGVTKAEDMDLAD